MPGMLDTAWTIAGWSLGAVAALALLCAIAGDAIRRRFRRIRRCPRCWYDLSHTPGLTCSECGFAAKRERQLFKTRRRKRWIVAALLLWIGSYFAFRTPAIKQRGWIAAVPTTALIFMWPHERVESGVGTLMNWSTSAARFLTPDTSADSARELFDRAERGEINAWQWRMLIEVALHTSATPCPPEYEFASGSLNPGVLRLALDKGRLNSPNLRRRALQAGTLCTMTRRQWPVGEPVYACLWTDLLGCADPAMLQLTALRIAPMAPQLEQLTDRELHLTPPHTRTPDPLWGCGVACGLGGCDCWSDGSDLLGQSDTPLDCVGYRVLARRRVDPQSAELLGVESIDIDTTQSFAFCVAGTIDEILTPVEVPEFDAALARQWRPQLHSNHLWLNLQNLTTVFEMLGGATFAVTIEVRREDTVIGRGSAWWCAAPAFRSSRGGTSTTIIPRGDCLRLEMFGSPVGAAASGPCTLRITPDPHMALRRFGSDRYWSGAIEITVQ